MVSGGFTLCEVTEVNQYIFDEESMRLTFMMLILFWLHWRTYAQQNNANVRCTSSPYNNNCYGVRMNIDPALQLIIGFIIVMIITGVLWVTLGTTQVRFEV